MTEKISVFHIIYCEPEEVFVVKFTAHIRAKLPNSPGHRALLTEGSIMCQELCHNVANAVT
jgi:hypothetical protein